MNSTRIKRCLIVLGLGFLSFGSYAQQEAMFTHYMYNTLAVNPAYAGSREALTVTALHRSQWVGFDGAPTTQTLTVHTPFSRPELGMGLSVFNDKLGPTHYTSFYSDFSYSINLENEAKFSFGLKAGINMLQVDLNSLTLTEVGDLSFANNVQSRVMPNFGFGMYYHSPTYYVGISTPRLVQNNLAGTIAGVPSFGKEKRHYYLIAGTVYDLSNSVKFKPTTFVKMTTGAPVEADLTAVFIFNEKLLAGGMFRTGDAFGTLIGFFVNPQLELGYSFDWSYGLSTGRYNGGSHEVMLRYDFIYKNTAKIRSPRYF